LKKLLAMPKCFRKFCSFLCWRFSGSDKCISNDFFAFEQTYAYFKTRTEIFNT